MKDKDFLINDQLLGIFPDFSNPEILSYSHNPNAIGVAYDSELIGKGTPFVAYINSDYGNADILLEFELFSEALDSAKKLYLGKKEYDELIKNELIEKESQLLKRISSENEAKVFTLPSPNLAHHVNSVPIPDFLEPLLPTGKTDYTIPIVAVNKKFRYAEVAKAEQKKDAKAYSLHGGDIIKVNCGENNELVARVVMPQKFKGGCKYFLRHVRPNQELVINGKRLGRRVELIMTNDGTLALNCNGRIIKVNKVEKLTSHIEYKTVKK